MRFFMLPRLTNIEKTCKCLTLFLLVFCLRDERLFVQHLEYKVLWKFIQDEKIGECGIQFALMEPHTNMRLYLLFEMVSRNIHNTEQNVPRLRFNSALLLYVIVNTTKVKLANVIIEI